MSYTFEQKENAQKLLENAKELIRKGFTKEVLARDDNDLPVEIFSSVASKFCAYGALIRAGGNLIGGDSLVNVWSDPSYELATNETERACHNTIKKDIVKFNNEVGTTAEDIVAVFDVAIVYIEFQVAPVA